MEETALHVERLADLSSDNRARCMTMLRQQSALPLHALATAIGLSRPTLKSHLDALVTIGFATQEKPRIGEQGGRPAVSYSLNPHGATLCAMEISLHEHRYLLLDLAGTIHHASIHTVHHELTPNERAELITRHINEFLTHAHTNPNDITCFTAAIGGQVGFSDASPHTHDRNTLVPREFATRFPTPLIVENDLNAAIYAEQKIGHAADTRDTIYALVWHQIAAGLILNGKLRRGAHGLAGELNLVTSSATSNPHQPQWNSWPDILTIAALAQAGHQPEAEQIHQFCTTAAQQLAYLITSVDPETLILGGPLAHKSPYIVEQLTRSLHNELPNGPTIDVHVSALADWGPSIGAALIGLENVEFNAFGATSQNYQLSNATSLPLPLPTFTPLTPYGQHE